MTDGIGDAVRANKTWRCLPHPVFSYSDGDGRVARRRDGKAVGGVAMATDAVDRVVPR